MSEQAVSNASYSIKLTAAERSAVIWALEVSRAVLVGNPHLPILLADETMTPQLLDDLADRLVLARDGKRADVTEPAN